MSRSQDPGWGQPPQGQPPHQQQSGQVPSGGQPPQWAPLPPTQSGWPTKYCTACGSTIDARATICPRCGVGQPGGTVGSSKSRPLTIVLALLLGNFGVHRFYLGDVAWGIVYLVFFWTSIPGFIAWFEALYFLTRSNEDWARMYGGPVEQPNGAAMGCLWILALLPLVVLGLGIMLVLLSVPLALTA